MTNQHHPDVRVGVALGSTVPPDELRVLARDAEIGGFHELWLAEDYFYTGGVATAIEALAATRSIPVGVAVFSALTRHPALLAMEAATIERMYPQRFSLGIGLGLPDWLRQMDLMPRSPLRCVRESVEGVRRLLEGDLVDYEGEYATFHKVRLYHPPSSPVPIYVGGFGPRMLRLSAEIGDGTLVAFLTSPAYISWVHDLVLEAAPDEAGHAIPAFALFAISHDRDEAKHIARTRMALSLSRGPSMLTDQLGISDSLTELISTHGPDRLAGVIPDTWVENLTISGDVDDCELGIRDRLLAGATSVVLFPASTSKVSESLRLAARHLLPRLDVSRS